MALHWLYSLKLAALLTIAALMGGLLWGNVALAAEATVPYERDKPVTVRSFKETFSLARGQLAAAAAEGSSFINRAYRFVCPWFSECTSNPFVASTTPTTIAPSIERRLAPAAPSSSPSAASAEPVRQAASVGRAAQPIQQTIINQPVIERIIERVVNPPAEFGKYVTQADLNAQLAAVQESFGKQLYGPTYPAPAPTPAGGGIMSMIAVSNNIDKLDHVTIENPTITGGTITAASIVGTIANTIETGLATITNLTVGSLVATHATTTSLHVSATTTTEGLVIPAIDCSSFGNGGTLTTDADGNVVCATDDGGAGSTVAGSDTQVQFNDMGSFGADSGFTYNKTSDRVTVVNASTTNLTASYASSTAGFFGSLTIGSLSGILKATAGAISTALVDLASDITGILAVGNGGTGWSALASGAVLYGNGTGAVATTSAGTAGQVLALLNGVPTWTSTTTLATIGGTLSGTQLDGVFSGNGMLTRTGSGTYTNRTLTGTSNQITITNGDGVSGNPTISLPSLLSLTQASSTLVSTLDGLYVGRTSTTTILGSATSTFGAGIQTTALNVTSSTATSTFANGIQLSAGCFRLADGTCAGAGSGSGIVSSGTQGQLPFYNAAGTTLTPTSTLTLLQNTNFGVGTSSPSAKLTAYGDAFLEGSSRYLNFGTIQGVSGYGIRDNAGTIQFKNTGGSWENMSLATTGPSFVAHRNGVSQAVTLNGITLINWTTETFDTNNNVDLSTERFTPTVPGKYMVTAGAYCDDATTFCAVHIYKNGATISEGFSPDAGAQGIATIVVDMNGSTDYLEVYVHNGGGNNLNGAANLTYFTGILIAPVSSVGGGWQNDGSQSYLIDSTDKVGIGTSTPWAKLSVAATVGFPSFVVASSNATHLLVNSVGNIGVGTTNPDNGKVEVKGGTVCVDTNSDDNASSCIASESDERLKENIESLVASSSLDKILALNPVSFDWRVHDSEVLSHYPLLARYASSTHSIGLIAQDVMDIIPEALSTETVGDAEVQYFQLDYTKFIPHLIGAIKELWARVEDIGKNVALLLKHDEEQDDEIESLKARVYALESQLGAAAGSVHTQPAPEEPELPESPEAATSTSAEGEHAALEGEESSEISIETEVLSDGHEESLLVADEDSEEGADHTSEIQESDEVPEVSEATAPTPGEEPLEISHEEPSPASDVSTASVPVESPTSTSDNE